MVNGRSAAATSVDLTPLPATFHVVTAGHWAFLVLATHGPCGTADAATAGWAQLGAALRTRRLASVHERIFGSLTCEETVRAARGAALTAAGVEADTPVTFVEGAPPWGEGLAGAIVAAVDVTRLDAPPETISDGGTQRGRAWALDGTPFVALQGLGSTAPEAAELPWVQARQAIEKADSLLRTRGLDYRAVIRTWFYLQDICSWYGEFNRERSAVYGRLGLLDTSDAAVGLPASTGVGGASRGGFCSLDVLAAAPRAGGCVRVERLGSPVQPDPIRYGSAFSRGAVVSFGDAKLVEVSGTAAIDETGASVYPGDPRAQVRYTLDVVDRLLGRAGASLGHIAAGVAFVRRPGVADDWRAVAAERGLGGLPVVCVVGDVCREELLFELDGQALVQT